MIFEQPEFPGKALQSNPPICLECGGDVWATIWLKNEKEGETLWSCYKCSSLFLASEENIDLWTEEFLKRINDAKEENADD